MCPPLSVNLMLTVAKSWYNYSRTLPVWVATFSGGNCLSYLVASLSCLITFTVCLSITFSNSLSCGVDGALQYEDIKGSHVVIHSQYFSGIP